MLARESSWMYPLIVTMHAIGMAFLVGTIAMIDLRILFVAREAPIRLFRKLLVLAWIGFAVNVLSGVTLFLADATKVFFNPAFRVKILLIVIGGVSAWLFRPLVFGPAADWLAGGVAPMRAKLLAAVSLISWVGAITAGRLIAYI